MIPNGTFFYERLQDILKVREDRIHIIEVSPRDGLSAVRGGTTTADKVRYINGLIHAGLRQIECAAFTHPRLIPGNADAEKVMAVLPRKPGVTYIGLAANEIGCRRALAAGIDEILTLVAASDVFNQLCTGKTKRETLHKVLPALFEAAGKAERGVRCYLHTAFGCPYTGKVSFDEVRQLFLALIRMGAKEIVLLDSTGMAHPKQVGETIKMLLDLDAGANLAVHFHNTRGSALVNCIAAYDAGARTFYTSIGGLSGTPYGARELAFGYWNVPTEDLVHLFEEMGIETGLDIDPLLECVEVAERLAGRPLPGHILRAHPSSRLAVIPDIPEMLKLQ
jgi:hydroxymethylglutaryl-CoA lyase